VDFSVRLLEEQGVHLKRPHADTVNRGSRFPNMRELRCQHEGRPYRHSLLPSIPGVPRFCSSEATRRQAELVRRICAPGRQNLRKTPERDWQLNAAGNSSFPRGGKQNGSQLQRTSRKDGPGTPCTCGAACHRSLKAMPLDGLRDARDLTQTQLAQVLHVSQGAVSKVERRTDMYISTLRSYVRAIGGDCRFAQSSRKATC